MNNNEQVFYIKYRQSDGYLTTLTDQKHYDELSDDDKNAFTQVIVDLKHLNGWGLYWNHVRYVNGALSYPDNYPKDQSVQISDLKNQLAKIIASNDAKEKSNQDLSAKLQEANGKINDANNQINQLKKLSMQLQLQMSNKASAASASVAPQGGNDHVSK